MDRAGDQLLARAGIAGDQDARIGAGRHVGLAELLLHQRRAGDDIAAPFLVDAGEARDLECLAHVVEQLLLLDGLGQEAERAALRGPDGVGDRAVGGEQDHLEARPAHLQLLEQPDAVHLVHAQVGDHEVRTEAADGRERVRRTLHRLDLVVLGPQADRQEAQQARVVIHREDLGAALLGVFAGTLHVFGASVKSRVSAGSPCR